MNKNEKKRKEIDANVHYTNMQCTFITSYPWASGHGGLLSQQQNIKFLFGSTLCLCVKAFRKKNVDFSLSWPFNIA